MKTNLKFPYSVVDLTHVIDETIPTWDGECGFQHHIQSDYADCAGEVKFRVGQFKIPAGIGTHLDAPAHCLPGGITVDQIPVSQLLAPCIVIDISESGDENRCLSVEDIKNFEQQFFSIPPGVFVMIKTGWEQFWNNPAKYRNDYRFPSVSKEAAFILLKRAVCGVGIDTLSPDRPESGYPVHQLFLHSGKLIVENAANLNHLPQVGGFIMPVPIKVREATEAPIRLLAFIPD